MRRESHVRFWEGVEVRFLRATRLIVLDEAHLRGVLARYFAYYNGSRCHLSLDGDTPTSRTVQGPEHGRVVALPEVGGLHHRYERMAA